MDPDEYLKKIENDILDIISARITDRKMDAVRARALARYILENLKPGMSLDEIRTAAKDFDKYFPELIPVAMAIHDDYEQQIKSLVLSHVTNLLKENKFDEAHGIIKKTLKGEIKIGDKL